jgi:hypothetical protein
VRIWAGLYYTGFSDIND